MSATANVMVSDSITIGGKLLEITLQYIEGASDCTCDSCG